ncbi:hypothetical protein EFS28_11095 [Lactobacillus acidophilus]|nr:hypothetical protein [Lactobacillus acidophilus]MCT3624701.1 hypothetical protein [Lactobacillus acidophilus]
MGGAYFAKNVIGKHGKVQAIITNGNIDLHDFEPTTNSVKKVAIANIVIANGLEYDSWMANLANSNDIKVTEVGKQLMGLKQGDNLHIWYDLSMPEKYVSYIVKRANEIDSNDADYFKQNTKKYLAKIDSIKKMPLLKYKKVDIFIQYFLT